MATILATTLALPLDPALLVAGVLFITGGFMLLAGRRMLRVGLGITGALIGLIVALAVQQEFRPESASLLWAAGGVVFGLALGLLLWRVTVASVMAVSFASVASLVLLLTVQSGMIELQAPLETASVQTASVQTIADTNAQLDALEETSRSWLASASLRLNETSGGLLQRLRDRFSRLEPALQTALTGAAILGGLAGFLTGLLAWKRSGVLVSSVAGAGLVLLGLWTAMESVAASSPEGSAESAHLSPASWLVAFAALSLAGAGFQWYLERRGADSSPEHGATEAIA